MDEIDADTGNALEKLDAWLDWPAGGRAVPGKARIVDAMRERAGVRAADAAGPGARG